MAKVAVVEGVTIMLYANEHPPPHFHAKFAEFQAVIDIRSLSLQRGRLPPNKLKSVLEWASVRKQILLVAFDAARSKRRVEMIP